ncbi:MAG: hypothetical protein LBD16_07200 [Oscillospiraceae bacterium]|jgi:hypothetical protein|nr:hypothetical protein [Oscillospiraceae bacterium]
MSLMDMDMPKDTLLDSANAAMVSERPQYITPRGGLRWRVIAGARIRAKK